MKKLGIVGGVAWPSTIDYYRAICRLSVDFHRQEKLSGPPPVPEMTIESLNIAKSFAMRGGAMSDHASWAEYERCFREALQRIEKNGAEVAIIASNTPHNRFSAITEGINIPVISIFEAVSSYCVQIGVSDMLILGTAPTTASPVFSDVLKAAGIRGFAPASDDERSKKSLRLSLNFRKIVTTKRCRESGQWSTPRFPTPVRRARSAWPALSCRLPFPASKRKPTFN